MRRKWRQVLRVRRFRVDEDKREEMKKKVKGEVNEKKEAQEENKKEQGK